MLAPRLDQEEIGAVMPSHLFLVIRIRTWEQLSIFVSNICCSEAATSDACCMVNDYHC